MTTCGGDGTGWSAVSPQVKGIGMPFRKATDALALPMHTTARNWRPHYKLTAAAGELPPLPANLTQPANLVYFRSEKLTNEGNPSATRLI